MTLRIETKYSSGDFTPIKLFSFPYFKAVTYNGNDVQIEIVLILKLLNLSTAN